MTGCRSPMWPRSAAEDDRKILGVAGMMPSWIMRGVWDFNWINVRKDVQGEGIGHALTEHRIREVLQRDGRAIHLMTRIPEFFEQWAFRVSRDYGGEGWKLMTLQLGPVVL